MFVYTCMCIVIEEIQLSKGDGWSQFTGLTLPHFCACPKPGPGFPKQDGVVFFFLFFFAKWFEVKGGCSFY